MGKWRGSRSLFAALVVTSVAMVGYGEAQAQDIPGDGVSDKPAPIPEDNPVPSEADPVSPEPVDPSSVAPSETPESPEESNPPVDATPPASPTPVPVPVPVPSQPVVPPPATTPPVPVSAPVSNEEKEAADRQRLIDLIKEAQSKKRRPQGPFGTRLYATANLDLSLGYASPAGFDATTSFTRYVDRGGYLPQMLLIVLQAVGAQAEANAAGRTIEKEIYVGTSVGMNIEFYGLEKDELDGAVYDLYWIFADQNVKLPTVINFGFTAGSMGMDIGVVGEGIIPIGTRFNAEVGGRLGFGDSWYQLNVAGVGNITDRFYGRAAYQYAQDLGSGYVASLGVRL